MSVAFVDNRDSFSFNVVQAFMELGCDVDVVPGESLAAMTSAQRRARVLQRQPQLVCLGPGPRAPEDTPGLLDVVTQLMGDVPQLGICLGMQAMHVALGGAVKRALHPVHGKRSAITHDGEGVFASLPSPLWVMRYHSLVLDENSALQVTARCDDGQPMAVRDVERKLVGLQFHPESIGTSGGARLLANAVRWAGGDVVTAPGGRLPNERRGALLTPEVKGPKVRLVSEPPEEPGDVHV